MARFILTPVMTSSDTPSGDVSADVELYVSQTGWRAFDQSTATLFAGGENGGTKTAFHWLEYSFDAPALCYGYRMFLYQGTQPSDWEFQGWNGSSWDTLDTQVAQDVGADGVWTSEYTLSAPSEYSKFRLYFTDWARSDDFYMIAELELLGDTDPVSAVPSTSLAFTPNAPTTFAGTEIELPVVNLAFSPLAPSGLVSLQLPAADLPFTPLNVTSYIPATINQNIPSTIIYSCVLTGSPDIIIPVKSFQARYRNEGSTYLAVIVPDGETWGTPIADRGTGELVLYRGARYADGSEELFELIRVAVDQIRDYSGGSSHSVSVEGHATFVNPTPKTVTLDEVTYRLGGTANRRIRTSGIDLNLRPGDNVTYLAETFSVDNMTYLVDSDGEVMEVEEG